MQTTRASVARVQLLLEALFLEHAGDTNDAVGNAALQWVSEWLGLEPSAYFGTQTLIYLVAVQLSAKNGPQIPVG